MAKETLLTGIKPTGSPHLGNYLGALMPALGLVKGNRDVFYFIADYHGLTTVRDAALMRRLTYEVTATWLALGLDPDKVILYRQSDIPEVFELTWVLSCFTAKGLMNRAHAYKATVDANRNEGKDAEHLDDGVNMGLFNYPILMAADIMIMGAHKVPVGKDQKQHIEIARDIAEAFNNTYGKTLVVPEAIIEEEVAVISGSDGRKMSKSYGNTIEIFASRDKLRKQVMQIVTDSKRPEEPKDPEETNIFKIYRYFATDEMIAANRLKYTNGGVGYGELKEELFELLDSRLSEPRRRYNDLMANIRQLDNILAIGADKARHVASQTLAEVRAKVGMN